jgi:hypothetical protein
MDDAIDTLVLLETMLHAPDARRDSALLQRILHVSFREFGQSGHVYDRDAIISALLAEEEHPIIWSQDFAAQRIDDQTVLLTYRSAIAKEGGELERHANRASIWLETDWGWQLVFHQGTPTSCFRVSLPSAYARYGKYNHRQ